MVKKAPSKRFPDKRPKSNGLEPGMSPPKVKPGQIWRARNGDVLHVECRNEANRLVGRAIDRGNAEIFPFDIVDISLGCVGTVSRDGTYYAGGDEHEYDLVAYLGEVVTHGVQATLAPGPKYEGSINGYKDPTDPAWLNFLDTVDRKTVPLATGLFDYFPDALAAVAHCSHVAQAQHGGGEVRWIRGISDDHDDAMLRHFSQRGTVDTDGVRHRAKVAWRALAALQIEIEEALNNAKT